MQSRTRRADDRTAVTLQGCYHRAHEPRVRFRVSQLLFEVGAVHRAAATAALRQDDVHAIELWRGPWSRWTLLRLSRLWCLGKLHDTSTTGLEAYAKKQLRCFSPRCWCAQPSRRVRAAFVQQMSLHDEYAARVEHHCIPTSVRAMMCETVRRVCVMSRVTGVRMEEMSNTDLRFAVWTRVATCPCR